MYEVWEPYLSFLEVGAMYVWKERTQERKRNGKGIRIFVNVLHNHWRDATTTFPS